MIIWNSQLKCIMCQYRLGTTVDCKATDTFINVDTCSLLFVKSFHFPFTYREKKSKHGAVCWSWKKKFIQWKKQKQDRFSKVNTTVLFNKMLVGILLMWNGRYMGLPPPLNTRHYDACMFVWNKLSFPWNSRCQDSTFSNTFKESNPTQ